MKKIKILLAGLLTVLFLFSGCSEGGSSSGAAGNSGGSADTGDSGDSGDSTAQTGNSDAKLTIWVYGWEKASADKISEDAQRYKEETGVTIEVVPIASDSYSTKIQATLAGGTNPDLAFMDAGVQSTQLASKGKLLGLTDYGVGEYEDMFYDSLWETMTYQDDVYGLRITSNNLALFYNTDMFDAAGMDYPTEDWTWDELRDAAKDLTDIESNVYGLQLPIYDNSGGYTWTWLPFLWQNGGEMLNEDKTEAVFNSPEGKEALEFWKAMVQEDKSVPLQAPATGVNRFTSGGVAMTIDGPWNLPTFVSDPDFKDKFGVAPLPQKEGRATVVGGECIAVFSNTSYPQEAYDYLVHLTISDFKKTFWENWLTIPTQPEFADFYADDELYGAYIQVFSDQMEISRTRPFTPTWPQIENALGLGLQDYMYDAMDDAQAALDQTVADVNKILAES